MSFKAIVDDARLMTQDGKRTMDAGQRVVTIAHHEHFVLRWAKKCKPIVCPYIIFIFDAIAAWSVKASNANYVKNKSCRKLEKTHEDSAWKGTKHFYMYSFSLIFSLSVSLSDKRNETVKLQETVCHFYFRFILSTILTSL